MKNEKEERLDTIFKVVAPGQPLRYAMEKIQEASLGGLIVLSSIEDMQGYIDGGFVLNTPFTPQKVYELAKMDGAVLISEDLKTIYAANIQLQPDKSVMTDESGTRHRTADRISKLTNKIVITISERRNRITVYKGDFKISLELVADLLMKSSQAIMSLEKYATSVNRFLDELNRSEFENNVILEEVLDGLKNFYLMYIMDIEVLQYIRELGSDARLVSIQHNEIMNNQKNKLVHFIKDYSLRKTSPEKIYLELINMKQEDIRDYGKVAKLLGYDLKQHQIDDHIVPKGYRILNSYTKINKKDVENLISNFENLFNILNANQEDISSIKGMGKFKTEEIIRLKSRFKNLLI